MFLLFQVILAVTSLFRAFVQDSTSGNTKYSLPFGLKYVQVAQIAFQYHSLLCPAGILSAVIFQGLLVSLATFVQVLFILTLSSNHCVGIKPISFDSAGWSAELKSHQSSKKFHISLSLLSVVNVFQDLFINLIISSSELSCHIGAKSCSVKSLANQGIFSKSSTTLLGLAQASFAKVINLVAL